MIRSHSFRPNTGWGLLLLPALLALFPNASQAQATTPDTTAASADMTVYRANSARTGFVDTSVTFPISVAWQNTTTPSSANASSPVIHDGVVFFGSGGTVYALNADSGSVKWTYPSATDSPTGSFDCPPTVVDGKVFIGNDNGKLYVLDEKTGNSLWQVTTGAGIRSSPVVDNGAVFFGSINGSLYAVRIDNQQPLWGGAFKTTGPITNAPVIADGNIFFTDSNNTLYCAVESTGRMFWSVKFDSSINDSPPMLVDGTLIVGSDRAIYGIAPRAGATRWQASLSSAAIAPAAASPDQNLIYVPTADGDLVAISTRGRVAWKHNLNGTASSGPIVTKNAILIDTKSGVLMALAPDDGHLLWSYSLHSIAPPRQVQYSDSGFITAEPLIAAGSIYALGNDGTITALKPNATDQLSPVATLNFPLVDTPVAGSQVPYNISILDAGSGVNPASLDVKVDETPLPVEYLPGSDSIQVKQTGAGRLFGLAPVPLPTLTAGTHTLTLSVSDWRGNKLDKTWTFTVDASLNAPGSTDAVNTNVAPNSAAQGQAGGGAAATPNRGYSPNGRGQVQGGGGVPGSGGPGGSAGRRGGGTGIGRMGGSPAPAPTPNRPPPTAPPGSGGNFPPPPPI